MSFLDDYGGDFSFDGGGDFGYDDGGLFDNYDPTDDGYSIFKEEDPYKDEEEERKQQLVADAIATQEAQTGEVSFLREIANAQSVEEAYDAAVERGLIDGDGTIGQGTPLTPPAGDTITPRSVPTTRIPGSEYLPPAQRPGYGQPAAPSAAPSEDTSLDSLFGAIPSQEPKIPFDEAAGTFDPSPPTLPFSDRFGGEAPAQGGGTIVPQPVPTVAIPGAEFLPEAQRPRDPDAPTATQPGIGPGPGLGTRADTRGDLQPDIWTPSFDERWRYVPGAGVMPAYPAVEPVVSSLPAGPGAGESPTAEPLVESPEQAAVPATAAPAPEGDEGTPGPRDIYPPTAPGEPTRITVRPIDRTIQQLDKVIEDYQERRALPPGHPDRPFPTPGNIITSIVRDVVKGLRGHERAVQEEGVTSRAATRAAVPPATDAALLASGRVGPLARQATQAIGIPATAATTHALTSYLGSPGEAEAAERAPRGSRAGRGQEDRVPAQPPGYIIDSLGGKTKVDSTEMAILGGTVLGSIGMAFAPSVFRWFKAGKVPRLRTERPVRNAPPGTVATSKTGDYLRTVVDDVAEGPLRMLPGMGVPKPAVDEVRRRFGFQTRGQARGVADAAVMTGRAETPYFRFRAPSGQSLARIARRDNAETSRYLHLRDTIDDINIEATRRTRNPQYARANPGPINIRGHDFQSAATAMRAMEVQNPVLRQTSRAYREQLNTMRRVVSSGEYATMSRARATELAHTRPNEVPWNGARVTGNPVERGHATQSLAQNMKVQLRERMENEAVGTLVDTVRRYNPNIFTRVTPAQLRANPNWAPNVVSFKRRGVPEHYVSERFLAQALKMDPYVMNGMAAQIFHATKRGYEITTTGPLAPNFALTSMIRNHAIQKLTAGASLTQRTGPRSARVWDTAMAIPQQLAPQLARSVGQALENGSNGWFTQTFGRAATALLSQRLAHTLNTSLPIVMQNASHRLQAAAERSVYTRMERAGGIRGDINQQQVEATTAIRQVIERLHPAWRGPLKGYLNVLESMHNAPNFAFVRRNLGRGQTDAELALTARGLTGDPRVGGQYYVGGTKNPITREVEGWARVPQRAAEMVGGVAEIARTALPWANPMIQGPKRLGQAYLENPARFTTQLWMYALLPATVSYLAARAMGKDPNGVSYSDHQMNGRSEYAKTMEMIFYIPGQPVERGIRVPLVHEFATAVRLQMTGLDHLFRSSIFSESEDFKTAMTAFFNTAVEPPMPPLGNLVLAAQGIASQSGIFSGDAYRRRVDPYDATGGLPVSIELAARAMGAGVADIVGASYAAFSQTPKETGMLRAAQNALSQGGERLVARTPIVRDVLGIESPRSGSTNITTELYKKQKVINDLTKYHNRWTNNEGMVNIKPQSLSGGEMAEAVLGPDTSKPYADENWKLPRAGLDQPPPRNPLYLEFMDEMRDRFVRDSSDRGRAGIGYKSMWRRMGDVNEQLSSLRNITAGSYQTYLDGLNSEKKAPVRQWLEDSGVDINNYKAVRSFFENKRQEYGRKILFVIKAVENDMSKRHGKKIEIEDLDPHKLPFQNWYDFLLPTPEETAVQQETRELREPGTEP